MKIGDVGIMVYVDAIKETKTVVSVSGSITCKCGITKYPRNEENKVIRGYWKAVYLIMSKGYTCPKCGAYYNAMEISKTTIKKWKKRHPDWPWEELKYFVK